jgi:lipopolysaccharide/colanic/teichoic acid biosynthesis glycosyltransferase
MLTGKLNSLINNGINVPLKLIPSFTRNKKNKTFKKQFLVNDISSTLTLDYLKNFCGLFSHKTEIVNTDNPSNIIVKRKTDCIVNFYRINDIRFINKFFEIVNEKLSVDNTFICCVETFTARRQRKSVYNIPILRNIYFCFEFVFLRIFPKVKFFSPFYFSITRGKNRLLSKAEVLGRLMSCGFDIVDYKTIDGLLYIVSEKKRIPSYDMNPSYGPIFKMPRVGKSRKIIHVYKLRTMHPYSEYLQDYIFEKNGSLNGDKVLNDFRISPVGSFFRKIWIDELPMLINLLKGELKLVGVRPLSISKFNMYPKKIQDLRTKVKPGLIPPFYADMPNDFNELVLSEKNYLNQYLKNPIFTDLKYFCKAFYNIIFNGARSK